MTLSPAPRSSPSIAPDRFRQVFRRYPAGVVVITLDAGQGPVGLTATSLASLSLTPPLVSFAIAATASCWPHMTQAASVIVHFLGGEQEPLARRFASRGIDRFAAPTEWWRLPTGEPVLHHVAGWLRLGIERIVPAGDHRIVIGRALDARLDADRAPLLFHDGAYHSLSPRTDIPHAQPHVA